MNRLLTVIAIVFSLTGCSMNNAEINPGSDPYVMVLGIAQDGGYPQAGCRKACCAGIEKDPGRKRHVVSLGIVDPKSKERWIIDATPDFREQLAMLNKVAPPAEKHGLTGIFLTHAHIGHYAGLVHLGREVMGVRNVPVFAMPRMAGFLKGNGPWDQLVRLRNVDIRQLVDGQAVLLNERISVTPILVPHRDEYSETVGYRIEGPAQSIFYAPDTDKWETWSRPIEELIAQVDVALLDGTFYEEGEIPGRNMADIPHPFIEESMARFAALTGAERAKIRFLHFNHTNPALRPGSDAPQTIQKQGFRLLEEGEKIPL